MCLCILSGHQIHFSQKKGVVKSVFLSTVSPACFPYDGKDLERPALGLFCRQSGFSWKGAVGIAERGTDALAGDIKAKKVSAALNAAFLL